jgi:phosphate/sulfate permease
LNFRNVVAIAVISSFGFLIALFWRDAITDTIKNILPEGEGLSYQFAMAIIVTIIAVIVIFVVSKYLKSPVKENK